MFVRFFPELVSKLTCPKKTKCIELIDFHTSLEPYLSREVCPPWKMSMDNCYMMPKDGKNVNGNPGELYPILVLDATKKRRFL